MRQLWGIAALAVVAGGWMGCQPEAERPGLWVRGETVGQRIPDWGFTNDIEEIFIETSSWFRLPHSVTIWCVELDGELYVGSYGSEKKTWEANIARRPEARLAIAGNIYDVILMPVSDDAAIDALDAAYAQKYDMAAVFGDEVPSWRYYRVVQGGQGQSAESALRYRDSPPELTFGPYSRQDSIVRNEPDTENFLTHAGTTFALKVLVASDSLD